MYLSNTLIAKSETVLLLSCRVRHSSHSLARNPLIKARTAPRMIFQIDRYLSPEGVRRTVPVTSNVRQETSSILLPYALLPHPLCARNSLLLREPPSPEACLLPRMKKERPSKPPSHRSTSRIGARTLPCAKSKSCNGEEDSRACKPGCAVAGARRA
jgi:hypothetical protein